MLCARVQICGVFLPGLTPVFQSTRETLRSDNGDVHENLTEKLDSASFQTTSRLSQVAHLLKRREFTLELKREGRAPQVRESW